MNKLKFFAASLLLTVSGSLFAQGAVSRACFISELSDNNLASPALLLFRYLGMPVNYYELRNKSRREQEEHAILESITTDYLEIPRYYLFAASRSYKSVNHPQFPTPRWRAHGQYESRPGADKIDEEVLRDSRLAMFFNNRNVVTSVRAGNPDFVEQLSFRSDENRAKMIVTGKHWYYDPKGKFFGYLQDTIAFDCNLSEIGKR